MALIIQKYGGTSMGDTERIKHVARRVAACKQQGQMLVVVVSAMSGETDRLFALSKCIQADPDPRELDVILASGEQVSIGLLTMALKEIGIEAISYTGSQAQILTDSAFTKARIQSIDDKRIRADLAKNRVVVVAGFQGVNAEGHTTTLGRGGSDTTAVALAVALKADECQIYTDVDGVYTTDPNVVPEARKLATITFEEMLEMASLGSKVLQIRSVELAAKYNVKLRVLSSFQEAGAGTLIISEEDAIMWGMEKPVVSGIAFSREEARINVIGIPDKPGIAYQIISAVAKAHIDVDMIIQNVGREGIIDFSFTTHKNEMRAAIAALESVQSEIGASHIMGDEKICKVSIVGIGMRNHVGVASKMFGALAEEGIYIQMISTSEIKTSVILDEKYLELAVRVLHKAFELEARP